MPRKERREGPPERERERPEANLAEGERESLAALKGILSKVAGLHKPLGLSPEEATDLVQRMYERVLELDIKLAGEPDEVRRAAFLEQVQNASIRRDDDQLVLEYPASSQS